MKIKTVLLPVVTNAFEDTVEFYKKITVKDVSLAAVHDGYRLSLIHHFVVLGSIDGQQMKC